MKALLIIGTMLAGLVNSFAQTLYYTGEWRDQANTRTLYTCVAQLHFSKDTIVHGEIVWTYHAIDSTDEELVLAFNSKQGSMAIEYVSGVYTPANNDLWLRTDSLYDSHVIITETICYLKSTVGKKVLAGSTTDFEGDSFGTQIFMIMGANGKQEFMRQKKKAEAQKDKHYLE